MKVTVVSTQNIPSPELGRVGKQDVLVVYTTDAGVTDTVIVPKESATPAAIEQAVKAHEDSKGHVVGHQFEV